MTIWYIITILEPIWVALLIPSLIFPLYFWEDWAYPWAIALLFIFWPVRLLRNKQLAPESPLNLPLLLLLLWAIVCILADDTASEALSVFALIASGIALYFAIVNATLFQDHPFLVAIGIGLVGLALASLGPAILTTIPTKLFEFDPSVTKSKPIDVMGTGETINPNILAGNLLLAIPLMVALALHWKWGSHWKLWRFGKVFIFGSAALLMISTLILSQSRGSYLALLVSLIVVFTLRWRWTLLLVAIVLISALSVASWDGLILLAEAIGSDGSITSLSGRGDIWIGAFFVLLHFPLFGIGLGQFEHVMPQLLTQLKIYDTGTIPHAHNIFLQVGLDLGIPGMLFYLWLWIATFVALIRALRFWHAALQEVGESHKQSDRKLRRSIVLRLALTEGALATSIALLVHGMVDSAIWGTKPSPVSWLIFALISLLYLPYASMHRMEVNNRPKGS